MMRLFIISILTLFLSIYSLSVLGSDAYFLRRPPISTKCQAMLDKKGEYETAIKFSDSLILRTKRLQKSIKYDRKASHARVRGILAKIKMKKDQYLKKRDKHYEQIIREGCPTF